MKNISISQPRDVPSFLVKSVPGFVDSLEYQRLDASSQSVPGLVMGQLGIFLRRLQSEALRSPPTATTNATLREVYRALEQLASSRSPEVQNLVVVEVLEHLHGPEALRAVLVEKFGVATRALYRRWIESASE